MKQITLDIGLASGPRLDNFCPGPNLQAWQHLQLWMAAQPRSPVPTYLWGESGSGKSHLLRALRAAFEAEGAAVGWLDAGVPNPPLWQDGWQAVLMDDVHLYNAEQQHAAFNWFVNAQSAQRGVVAAGVLPVADLRLREDLRTRLGWGHVFALHLLSEAERRAVLRRAADERGAFLGDDVMDFLMTRFSRDLSSLMEMLDLLDAYALQTQRAITVPLVKTMMENL